MMVHVSFLRRSWCRMRTNGLLYSLSNEAPVKWNANQENTLLKESAQFSRLFDASLTAANLTERVRAAYVQYLWLPEVRSHQMSHDVFDNSVGNNAAIPPRTSSAQAGGWRCILLFDR